MCAVLILGMLWIATARLTEEPQTQTDCLTPLHSGYARLDTQFNALSSRAEPSVNADRQAVKATIRISESVTVSTARFRLGDIALVEGDETLCQTLRQIELGASPLAGQSRLFTRQQLITRLRQHGIDLSATQLEMPHTVRITRGAQSLDTTQLEQFAREQLRAVLGESAGEWTLENPPAPPSIPSGAVSFRLEGEPRVASQSATLEVVALVENQPRARYLLRFKAPAKARQIAVRSGESVQVRVVADGVVLEVKGVARATGALDETIPVYIPETQKTLRAQIVDTGILEVRL
ncbi:MAG: flagella basal body P-ring formation protein FlgA [Armatimonadetes bacterium]|nr:flagella basal body P-ring formation protein FlgA [Armatimonadota bacterium]